MDNEMKNPEDYMFEFGDEIVDQNPDVKSYYDKDVGDYMVVLGDSVFQMDDQAHMPDGVNLYAGEIDQFRRELGSEVAYDDLPDGVKKGISNRLD